MTLLARLQHHIDSGSKYQTRGIKMSKHIKAPGLRAAAITAANAYAEAFRKAYPQKTVVVTLGRNAAGDYEFRVWVNGDGGDRRLTWDELKEATAAFLR